MMSKQVEFIILAQCWRALGLLPQGRRFDLHTEVTTICSCEEEYFLPTC